MQHLLVAFNPSQASCPSTNRTRRLHLKSVWSIETFAVDECVEVTIISGYFQLVLFMDRIRISLLYISKVKRIGGTQHGEILPESFLAHLKKNFWGDNPC